MGAKGCNCPACNPLIKPKQIQETPRKLTLKKRIHKQRLQNNNDADETWAYVQANESRYAEQRESVQAGCVTDSETECKQQSDEMDSKWLTVPRGQLTFNAEGNDSEGSLYFSRKAHVPNNNGVVIGISGITIGRGLDLGSRTATNVSQLFHEVAKHCKPLSNSLLEWLKSGASIKGQSAYDYYKTLNPKVLSSEQELTRKQQHFLFLEIYTSYEKETERLLTKDDVRSAHDKEHYIVWKDLPKNIKDVLVDMTYRGDNRSSSRKLVVPALVLDIKNNLKGESSNLYKVMKSEIWKTSYNVDVNRYETRYKELLK